MVIPVYDDDDTAPGFRAWVVWFLFVLNIGVFLFMTLFPPLAIQLFAYHFGVVPAFIAEGARPDDVVLLIPPQLTLLTYTFLHGNWVHLAANMLFLWVLGDNVEMALGHLRFFFFYLLCGIVGGVVHIVMDPTSTAPLIGASGAISGIVSAYVLLRPTAHVTLLIGGILPITTRAYWVIAIWLAWQIANLVVPMAETNVAYWTHIAGFVTGIILTALLRRPGVTLPWFTR